MNQHAITEVELLAVLELEVAVLGLIPRKVAHAKDIGGEEAVGAGVPVSGMPRILRMVENRDAQRLAFNRARVVYPRRRADNIQMSFLTSPRHGYAALAEDLRFDTENVRYVNFSVGSLFHYRDLGHCL